MRRDIDIALLRAFVAVVETGSVTEAAGLLNLTQAAVSQQLKRLEELFGAEFFERQTQEYRDSVLPPAVKARVAVEQASTFGWERYVGSSGHVVGMRTFGASAPLKALQEKFGFEPERVVASAKELLGKQ